MADDDLTLYIDADVLVYEAAFAAQKNVYHYDGRRFDSHADFKAYCELIEVDHKLEQQEGRVERELQVLPEKVALSIARDKLQKLREEFSGRLEGTALAMSGETNFRDTIAVTKGYKANREGVEKPVHFEAVKDYYRTKSFIVEGQEADDTLGIWMAAGRDTHPVLASIDKDLIQIPGLHFDWNKYIKYNVSVWEAHLYFMAQVLAGDPTDNVPGLKGIGMKKALAGLRGLELRDMWQHVIAMYQMHEHPPEYLAEQGALVWVRRVENEVWTPDYYREVYIDRLNESAVPRRV